jgi:hypothetical protein
MTLYKFAGDFSSKKSWTYTGFDTVSVNFTVSEWGDYLLTPIVMVQSDFGQFGTFKLKVAGTTNLEYQYPIFDNFGSGALRLQLVSSQIFRTLSTGTTYTVEFILSASSSLHRINASSSDGLIVTKIG